MKIESIKLALDAYAEAVAIMGSQPIALAVPEYEEVIRLMQAYMAGWRHAQNNTKSAT